MGLLDVLNGMQNGPRGPSTPSAQSDSGGGMSPMTMAILALLAWKGIKHFTEAHPDVPVFTAAIDSHLNEKGYIVPGLGDAGDRMYGTK